MVDFDFPTAVGGLIPKETGKAAGKLYRPKVLETATAEVMTWLKTRPTYVDRVHPRTFEAIVAEILKDKGWEVELTKMTRDGGYDVLAIRSNALGIPISLIVECKLFALRRPVGIGMIDRLMGVLLREESARAMLVTNSRFSRDAWRAWQSRVHRDLHMVDREELFDWLRAYHSEKTET